MDPSPRCGASLFVFAHQDDELCAAPIIAEKKAEGRPVRVFYLTDGRAGQASSATRDRESRNALAALGVSADEIAFLGTAHGFPDGRLHTVLPDALRALEDSARSLGPVRDIFTLAYEGGHQDHDATHAAAVVLARRLGLLERTRQIPFYRAGTRPGFGVAVLAPLAENGPASYRPMSAAERVKVLALTRRYASQWRVLVVLGPLLAAACAVRPGLPMQPVSIDRLRERPSARPLFYERRHEVNATEVSGAIARLTEEA